MKNVRIYKDDIRQNILKSMFLTDTTIFAGGGILVALVIYLILHYGLRVFSWNIFLRITVVAEIVFIAFVTHKIDNQPIYKVFPRFLKFKRSRKELRNTFFDKYFNDFIIQDNMILRKDSLVKIYNVEPFDVALLNDQDREHFYLKLKQAIHSFPAQVQFISRKETAKPEDYSNHFFALYDRSNQKRETLIREYVEELSDFISQGEFTRTKHYASLSVSCNTGNYRSKLSAINKLQDMGMRFASSLASCDITTSPVVNKELISFMQLVLR